MKTFFSSLLIVLISTQLIAQKVIEHPRFGFGTTAVSITEIKLGETETALTFKVNLEPGRTFGIANKSYIQVAGQSDTLFMTGKDAPEPVDGWITVPEGGMSYTLYFPPIDPETERIDFGEVTSGPWMIYDIIINKPPYSSILPEEFSGHWFSKETGEWTYSFFENNAIVNSQVWDYETVEKQNQTWKILLASEGNLQTLYAKKSKNNTLFGGSLETIIPFTNEFMTSKKPEKEQFTAPLIQPGNVTYSGFIKGFSERMGTNTGTVTATNILNREMTKHVLTINDNGYFTITFPLELPQIVQVRLPNHTTFLFLEPGTSLFHLSNPGIPDQQSLFMGEGAQLNYDMANLPKMNTGSMPFMESIANMDFKEYAEYIQSEKDKSLSQLKNNKNLTGKALQIGELNIIMQYANVLMRFNSNKRMGYYYANRKLNDNEQIPFKEEKIDPAVLLPLLNETPVNDEMVLLSNQCNSLISSLRSTDFELGGAAYYSNMLKLKNQLVEGGLKLSAEEQEMFEFLQINFVENQNSEASRNFSQMYRDCWIKFLNTHRDDIQKYMNAYYDINLTKNLKTIFGLEKCYLKDVYHVQNYLSNLTNSGEVNVVEYREVKQSVDHPDLKEYVIEQYYKKKAEQEILASGGELTLKSEGDKIFHNIIKEFKGKVIYVDFWATWCGPCKAGIERIKPLKEELKNEDIAFVYITNPTSPDKLYNEMIPDIKGEHFKLSSDEWNHISAKFNIYGIPHYTLVDKNGRIVQKHMPHLDNDALKKVLLDLTKK